MLMSSGILSIFKNLIIQGIGAWGGWVAGFAFVNRLP